MMDKEMEKIAAIGSTLTHLRSISPTALRHPSVIEKSGGSLIHSQKRRLLRWTEQ